VYLFHHPDLVEELLVHRHREHHKHHSFFWSNVEAVFGRGLLTNEGDDWLRQRRLIQPTFQPERVARYAEIMIDRTRAQRSRRRGLGKAASASWICWIRGLSSGSASRQAMSARSYVSRAFSYSPSSS